MLIDIGFDEEDIIRLFPENKRYYRQQKEIDMLECFKITLSDGSVIAISEESIRKIVGFKWRLNGRYVMAEGHDDQRMSLHRFLTSAAKGEVVDHINRNTFDNRLENLRIVDSTKNRWNSSPTRDEKYKGVVQLPSGNFSVKVINEGVLYPLGTYSDLQASLNVYNNFIFETRGKYAVLNTVEKVMTTKECQKYRCIRPGWNYED